MARMHKKEIAFIQAASWLDLDYCEGDVTFSWLDSDYIVV
jgi:hypothetical protein